MHRRLAILIVLQIAELFMLAVIMVCMTGCASAKGLHSNNTFRNANARSQGNYEWYERVVK